MTAHDPQPLSLIEVAGCARRTLDAAARRAITAFVESCQCADGGFRGRGQASDLYYTLFAAGTLYALGRVRPLMRLRGFLRQFDDGASLDLVHLACLVQLFRRAFPMSGSHHAALIERLESFRAQDGGYHQTMPGALQGTAYAAYVASTAYAEANRSLPSRDRLMRSLNALRASDGGYANEPDTAVGATNATAAALMVRAYAGEPCDERACAWLLDRCNTNLGGFAAHPSAPIPDLLSTASALYAFRTVGASLESLREKCRSFVEMLWCEDGGFCGSPTDAASDCEYTFYALLALGSLA